MLAVTFVASLSQCRCFPCLMARSPSHHRNSLRFCRSLASFVSLSCLLLPPTLLQITSGLAEQPVQGPCWVCPCILSVRTSIAACFDTGLCYIHGIPYHAMDHIIGWISQLYVNSAHIQRDRQHISMTLMTVIILNDQMSSSSLSLCALARVTSSIQL